MDLENEALSHKECSRTDEARETVQVVLWRERREGLPRERCRISYTDIIA